MVAERLVPHAVLASEQALNNLDHRLMFLGRLGSGSRCGVCGGDIGKEVVRILFADDFEVSQRKKERLTDAKGRHALGIIAPCVVCHLAIPFDCEPIAS